MNIQQIAYNGMVVIGIVVAGVLVAAFAIMVGSFLAIFTESL